MINRLFSLLLLLAPFAAVAQEHAAAELEAPLAAVGEGARIRAQLSALHHTVLSGELSARIARLELREGEGFKAGDTLVAFDCAVQRARLKKARAVASGARNTRDTRRRLAKLNAGSALELEQAEAKAAETAAEVEVMRATVAKCEIEAPFDGRVVRRHAEPHQYLSAGKPLLEILDPSRLEVELILPSRWLAWLRADAPFVLHVEETGRGYPARVARVGSRIDPVSQSVPVAAHIDGDHPELLPGMSGWAEFPRTAE